ncbi:hypothetical protein R3P38DRAFT_2788962 [Favolaschia claudopus]|uniref:Uncharacterized protein n=1 Tax=Favolaschia claudopus TaxID=2862362 RepID=A0AAW0AIP1_9AGAR
MPSSAPSELSHFIGSTAHTSLENNSTAVYHLSAHALPAKSPRRKPIIQGANPGEMLAVTRFSWGFRSEIFTLIAALILKRLASLLYAYPLKEMDDVLPLSRMVSAYTMILCCHFPLITAVQHKAKRHPIIRVSKSRMAVGKLKSLELKSCGASFSTANIQNAFERSSSNPLLDHSVEVSHSANIVSDNLPSFDPFTLQAEAGHPIMHWRLQHGPSPFLCHHIICLNTTQQIYPLALLQPSYQVSEDAR